jgi:hypothetical protein
VYLDDPIVAGDERLRLRVLVIKAEIDEDLDPALSQRSWSEALAIAERLGEAGRAESRARRRSPFCKAIRTRHRRPGTVRQSR